MITIYTTGCPNCLRLEKLLDQKNIPYERCEDMSTIRKIASENGIMSVPILQVNDEVMVFSKAQKWIKQQ